MPEIDVHVRCENEVDQAEVVARLDELELPDGSFVADPTDAYFLLQAQSADAALARASVLVRGALAVTAIDPATVSLSVGLGWLA